MQSRCGKPQQSNTIDRSTERSVQQYSRTRILNAWKSLLQATQV